MKSLDRSQQLFIYIVNDRKGFKDENKKLNKTRKRNSS